MKLTKKCKHIPTLGDFCNSCNLLKAIMIAKTTANDNSNDMIADTTLPTWIVLALVANLDPKVINQ